jgi:hypothetical protein
MRPIFRSVAIATLLASYACSGSISCGGCGAGPLDPIPGGFPAGAQIERAAQVRLTRTGLDFIESEFQNLTQAFVSMTCGGPTDPPCPTGFVTVPGGAPNPSSCDLVEGACVESATGDTGPLVGFEIAQTVQSGATVCRDDINDPNRRRCFAYIRFEGLQIEPMPANQLLATMTAQIYTTELPIRYDPLGMDCLVTLDSSADGMPLQDILITAVIDEWTPPSGSGGRQLDIEISTVDAPIPDDDLTIERDPVHGGIDDFATCLLGNLGVIKSVLIGQLTGSLADIVGEEVDKAMGMACGGAMDPPCPAQTTCNADDLCEENASNEIVPVKLGLEGRLDLGALLGGFSPGRPGQGDIAFLVGGPSPVDAAGMTLGALGGAEVVTPDPSCAQILPSPRTRAGFMPPPQLPTVGQVDLDFDGTTETDYMVAAGISEALMDQYLWTVYTTGLFCTSLSAYDVDLLNTGTLGLLMPSLSKLTHNDKYRWAIYPARITVRPGNEPQITLGSGKVTGDPMMPVLEEPLLSLSFDDMRIGFFAMVEERWIQLMVLQLDLTMGLGAIVTPSNEVQLVIGDIADAISDVRITENEILAEDPADLEAAIPALLNFALPNFTGALPPIPLPTASELAGFELDVLGVRGVAQGAAYPNIAVYANLGFDPSQVPNLSLSAETSAAVAEVRLPRAEAMAASKGGERPVVVLELAASVPAGAEAEYQIRIDGGMWTPFFRRHRIELARSELLLQGRHVIEARARVAGAYRTLDATPAVVEVVIDPEPPRLHARLVEGGVEVDAFDVVDGDEVTIEVIADGGAHRVSPGFVAVDGESIAVAAADASGNRAEVVLRERGSTVAAAPPIESGCRCASRPSGWAALLLAGCALFLSRRR